MSGTGFDVDELAARLRRAVETGEPEGRIDGLGSVIARFGAADPGGRCAE